MTKRANPFTKILIGMLAIVVVMLVFTFGSFGTDSTSVLSGYDSTRRYATDSKKMQASVDVFKEAVKVEVDYNNDVKEREAVGFKDLPAYGSLPEDSTYETFAAGFTLKAGTWRQHWSSDNPKYKISSPTVDINCAATMNAAATHFFTTNDKAEGQNDMTLCTYGGWQCAGFANYILAEVTELRGEWDCNYGMYNAQKKILAKGCMWKDTSLQTNPNTEQAAKEFFAKVTPCTLVRTENGYHSYIVLGADDENIIIYDCNEDLQVGIKLHKFKWAEFAKRKCYTGAIIAIISPNEYLPDGCYHTGMITGNSAIKKGESRDDKAG